MDKKIEFKITFRAPKGAKPVLDENIDYDLGSKFDSFNRRFFQNKLPKPRLQFRPLKGKSGEVTYQTVKGPTPPEGIKSCRVGALKDYHVIPNSVVLTISNVYHREEDSLDGILLHEMIHIYMAINGALHEGHGTLFRQTARSIETKIGFSIPLTDDVSGLPLMTQRVMPIAVVMLVLKNGASVFLCTSENVAKAKAELIRRSLVRAIQMGKATKGGVILIKTEHWFHKARSVTASRTPEKLSDLYRMSSEDLSNLTENGTVVVSVDGHDAADA